MKIFWKITVFAVLLIFSPLTCLGGSRADLTVLFTGDLVGQLTPRRA